MASPRPRAGADATPQGWARVAVVAGLLAVIVACLFWLPRVLFPPFSDATLRDRGIADARDRVELQQDRLRFQNEVRTTLFQGAGGLAILLGAYFTWRQLQENVRNNRDTDDREREAQLTERFTRAIDQFGHQALDVKLGGLYSLERIAGDSGTDRDRRSVADVLAAFVRRRTAELAAAEASSGGADDPPELQVRAPDLQAVLTVLGRLGVAGLDLEGVCLYRANLTGAQLEGSNLQGADLRKADLSDAQLPEASIAGANLAGARLDGATLDDANLFGASLEGTSLRRASLQRATASSIKASGAWLTEADLRGAALTNAHLNGAWLSRADLRQARLLETDLSYANLDDADLTAAELNGARLREASLKRAKLAGTKVVYSDLSRARLEGASLRGADLTASKLVGASILGAHLDDAVLLGADLSEVEMSPALPWQGTVHLAGAVADRTTIWPGGWDRQQAEAAGVRFPDEPATGAHRPDPT